MVISFSLYSCTKITYFRLVQQIQAEYAGKRVAGVFGMRKFPRIELLVIFGHKDPSAEPWLRCEIAEKDPGYATILRGERIISLW